jgi:hypothetical protein
MWIPEEPQTLAADTTPVTIVIAQDQTLLPGGRGQLAFCIENNGAVEVCLVWDAVTGASPLKVAPGTTGTFLVLWNTRVYKLWASASASCDVTVATAPEGYSGPPPFGVSGELETLADIETELLDQGTTLDALETEQAAQGLSLDAIVTDIAALEVEALAQGISLDTILLLDRLPRDCIYRAGPSGAMEGTAIYASGTEITLASLPWVVDSLDVLWVEVHRTGGEVEYHDRVSGGSLNLTVAVGATTVLTVGGSPALLATDEYVVYLAGPRRGYDASIDAERVYVTNWREPAYEQWAQESDATSGATNFYEVSLEGYDSYRFDYDLEDGELTIYSATSPTYTIPTEGGSVTSEWNEETDYSSLDTGAGGTLQGSVDIQFTGAICLCFEWVPYDGTSELTITGKRGY